MKLELTDFTDKEVKRRPKPELNEHWWKEAWPGQTRGWSFDGMTKAIKAYKQARLGTSLDDLTSALTQLSDAVEQARDEAERILKKWPNRRDAILKDIGVIDRLIADERKKTSHLGSKTREVFRYDFAAQVTDRLKSDPVALRVKINTPLVRIELLEIIVQELDEKNGLDFLYAQYSNALEDQADDAAQRIIRICNQRVGCREDYTAKLVQQTLDDHDKQLAELHHKFPTNAIRNISLSAETEEKYRKQLNKRRLTIAKAAGSTVLSGAAVFLPVTQAFAIAACARTTAGLAEQIVEHNPRISKAAEILEEQLFKLCKKFETAEGRAASETIATTVNAVLGFDFMPTLDKAKSSFETLSLNTKHAAHETRKMTGAIMKMMGSLEQVGETLDSLPQEHKDRKDLEK